MKNGRAITVELQATRSEGGKRRAVKVRKAATILLPAPMEPRRKWLHVVGIVVLVTAARGLDLGVTLVIDPDFNQETNVLVRSLESGFILSLTVNGLLIIATGLLRWHSLGRPLRLPTDLDRRGFYAWLDRNSKQRAMWTRGKRAPKESQPMLLWFLGRWAPMAMVGLSIFAVTGNILQFIVPGVSWLWYQLIGPVINRQVTHFCLFLVLVYAWPLLEFRTYRRQQTTGAN